SCGSRWSRTNNASGRRCAASAVCLRATQPQSPFPRPQALKAQGRQIITDTPAVAGSPVRAPDPHARNDGLLYGAAVLTGAALVFQIQPIAGKLLLPSYGGGASVWTTCLFFFQAMLLAGYSYAHALARIRDARRQAALHAVLILLSLTFLPAEISADPFNPGSDN